MNSASATQTANVPINLNSMGNNSGSLETSPKPEVDNKVKVDINLKATVLFFLILLCTLTSVYNYLNVFVWLKFSCSTFSLACQQQIEQ